MKSRRTKPGRPDSAVIIESWRARAETALSRHELRRRRWVELDDVARAWRRVVALITHVTLDWPRQIAERWGRASSEEAGLLAWADGPRILPLPSAAECAKAEKLIRELITEPASWPRVEADLIAEATARGISEWIARRTALRRGVEMSSGLWHRPAPGRRAWLEDTTQEALRALDEAEARRRHPQPFLRPLLQTFAHAIETAPEIRALERVLAVPKPLPLPAQPRTTAKAREQYLRAQAVQARLRTAVERGGYVRREQATQAVRDGLAEFRAAWWRWQAHPLAGHVAAALASAETLRTEALVKLAALDGLLPATPAAVRAVVRTRKKKAPQPTRRAIRKKTPRPARRATRKTTKGRLRR